MTDDTSLKIEKDVPFADVYTARDWRHLTNKMQFGDSVLVENYLCSKIMNWFTNNRPEGFVLRSKKHGKSQRRIWKLKSVEDFL